jgi:DNA processing protein
MQGMDPPPERTPGRASDRELLLALNTRLDLSRAALCRLAVELPRWRDRAAPDRELATALSMDLDTLSKAFDVRKDAPALAAAADRRAEELGARLLALVEPDYPAALRELSLPPPAVHVAGELDALAAPAVAIVGSREASAYGREVATWLATELARAGLVVVSGFARGIDAAAHRGALDAGGRTVAVLGCGLVHDYPRGQRPLAAEIRGHGALLAELSCEAPPAARHFPVRNRIIAALARATIVVEAAPRSGSLITARLALDLGREVLAVPGRVTDELAQGTNALVRDGAAPVSHPADVLEALGWGETRTLDFAGAPVADSARAGRRNRPATAPPALKGALGAVFAALDDQRAKSPDLVAEAAEIGVDQALAALLELELTGLARREAGGLYRRR